MKNKLFLISLAILFAFTSCSEKENITGSWQIESLKKDGVYQELLPVELTVTEQDNELLISGTSTVNLFNGNVKFISENEITCENIASTRMMGSPEAMELETLFFDALSGKLKFTVKNDILTLTDSEKQLEMTFKKAAEKSN